MSVPTDSVSNILLTIWDHLFQRDYGMSGHEVEDYFQEHHHMPPVVPIPMWTKFADSEAEAA